MAIEKKSGRVIQAQSANELPQFELRFPPDVLDRFPSLTSVQQRLSTYQDQIKRVLTRLLDEQNRLTSDIQTTLESVSTLQTSLQTQIDALASTPVTAATASVDLTPLQEELDAHIAATAAHGVTGNVVGTNDNQSLDNKTIGFTGPGHARFLSLAVTGIITIKQSVEIPAGFSAVYAQSLEVLGGLDVNGSLAIVAD